MPKKEEIEQVLALSEEKKQMLDASTIITINGRTSTQGKDKNTK